MTVARSQLVDVNVTRWYHTISRCSRRANLFGEGEATGQEGDRKAWIERRLQELDNIFAVSTGGFAVLDNHLHLLLRIDVDASAQKEKPRTGNVYLRQSADLVSCDDPIDDSRSQSKESRP